MAMTVISANVEGLTAIKAFILSVMCKEQYCHCLCLQETHRSKDQAMPRIPGMALVAERPHNKHDSSVFIRDGLNVNNISVSEEENVELITVELPGVVVHSMYKQPPEPFWLPAVGQRNKPHIVIGHFNSHSTTNNDGEYVEQWADSNSLSLIHNVKLPKSFNSAICKNGYNPDLIVVSSTISDMCEISVLDRIPRTQHRPVNPVSVSQPTTSRRRFNLKKANWDGFSTEFDAAIEEGNSIPEDTFQEDVDKTTYLFSRRSPRASMKHTQGNIQATLLAKLHWRLEQGWSTQWNNGKGRFQRSQPTRWNCLATTNASKSRSTPILTVRCSFHRGSEDRHWLSQDVQYQSPTHRSRDSES